MAVDHDPPVQVGNLFQIFGQPSVSAIRRWNRAEEKLVNHLRFIGMIVGLKTHDQGVLFFLHLLLQFLFNLGKQIMLFLILLGLDGRHLIFHDVFAFFEFL
jgi:hypothetical protein